MVSNDPMSLGNIGLKAQPMKEFRSSESVCALQMNLYDQG